MSVTNMVTLSWIAQVRYLLQEPQQFITNLPEVAMPGPVQDITMKTGTGEANPDNIHIIENIADQVITVLSEATQGHNTRTDIATIGAAHDDHNPL